MKRIILFLSLALVASAAPSNNKTGISMTFGGTEGTVWAEEYLYHDKSVSDEKVVYILDSTDITLAHNARNMTNFPTPITGRTIIGINGLDGAADSGDEGIIRYKVDRDRGYNMLYADTFAKNATARVAPSYSAPFSFSDLTYDGSTPVVGTTGSNGVAVTSKATHYWRGILDSVGDEWHVLAVWDDDNVFLRQDYPDNTVAATALQAGRRYAIGVAGTTNWVAIGAANNNVGTSFTASGPGTGTGTTLLPFVDQAFYCSDGRITLFVVNPKTPCFTAAVTGTGQFYTTPPKAYFTPKIHDQTTYISPGTSGTVTITLAALNGSNVFYRIGGGSFIDAGADTVTLDDGDFSDGSNSLQYYFAGNAAYTKTRTVVKNPTHPSLAESHGNALWVDGTGYTAFQSRLTRSPYLSTYNTYKTSADQAGHSNWASYGGLGYRMNDTVTSYSQSQGFAIKNAVVAKVEGWSYTRSGAPYSHGEYAKKMLLENPMLIPQLGYEKNHSADSIPTRENIYRGYYDTWPILANIFAYDIMVANFRSDQVSGGITPIEDYFLRDGFAQFVYLAEMWQGGFVGEISQAPQMWGGARTMGAVSIGIIMSEYSSPVYGTSGFGTASTTYLDCPFPGQQLTWKQVVYDSTATKTAYPNLAYYNSVSTDDPNSLIAYEGQVISGRTYSLGTWADKAAYFSLGLMGNHLGVWSNMKKMYDGSTDSRWEALLTRATQTDLIGTKDPYPQTGIRASVGLNINSRWPDIVTANRAWMQSLASNNNDSDDKVIQDGAVFGMAFFDDGVGGGADTTAPTVSSVTVSAAGNVGTMSLNESVAIGAGGSGGLTMSMSGGAVTATLGTPSSNTIPITFSRTINQGETGTWTYTQPGNGIEDVAGNDLSTATSQTVNNQSTAGATDTTAPTPNPPTIESVGSITTSGFQLTASAGSDASGPVEYRLSTDDGETWGSWQASRVFNETGLASATTYPCRVQMRDSAAVPNETAVSATVEVVTTIAVNPYPYARARRSPVQFGAE